MGRCRWGIIGRQDYVEAESLSDGQTALVKSLKIVCAKNRKTIYDVFKHGKFIGQVRTTYGGQFYRKKRSDEFIFVTNKWNSNDIFFGRAVIALIESAQSLMRDD